MRITASRAREGGAAHAGAREDDPTRAAVLLLKNAADGASARAAVFPASSARLGVCAVLDQCRKTTVSFRYHRVGEDSTPFDGTAWTASPRRAAATAGCAVSLRNFGQAELKRADYVDGNQSCLKLGQNGEYRPPR